MVHGGLVMTEGTPAMEYIDDAYSLNDICAMATFHGLPADIAAYPHVGQFDVLRD